MRPCLNTPNKQSELNAHKNKQPGIKQKQNQPIAQI